jgi:predicted nucleic acid-binding protein
MASLTCLTDPTALLVVDASAIINLNASGCAKKIAMALPNRLAVTHIVSGELDSGRARGRRDAAILEELVGAGLLDLVKLEEDAEKHFEKLVVGPAAMTLDDGEAATIACALSRNSVAIIDERKATRICAERFPALRLGCTVDIFAHEDVQRGLGNAQLAEALFNALHRGRMRVFPHHVEWVVNLIGKDRAALCISLPVSARLSSSKVSTDSGAP